MNLKLKGSTNIMLKGKQKKLDKNNNNKIDSEDFKLLRGTKKGMRMGGEVKPMKAALGAIAMGALGAAAAKKFFKKKKTASPVIDKVTEKKKELLTGAAKSGGMMQKKMGGGMMRMGYKSGGSPKSPSKDPGTGRRPGLGKSLPGTGQKKKSDKGGGADMSKVPNARGRLRDAIKKFQRERMNAKEMIPLKSKSGGAINKKGKPRKVVGLLGFKGKAKDYPGALKLLNMKKNVIKK
jgi:hypothetical protein